MRQRSWRYAREPHETEYSDRLLATALGALCSAAACAGCLTPPAVLAGRHVDAPAALASYPAGSESVEYEVEPGVWLRGVFVPAGAEAPLVLHLLESSGSAAATKLGFQELASQLADLGFASLLIDYRGVGASDGGRSPKNLAADALVAWRAALERAGGPEHVWIRATSLGTLAAALLWRADARPAGTLWLLPVRAETATERYARAVRGPVWAWAARFLYRDIVEIDLVRELARAPTPCRVIASPDDPFLIARERASLEGAARAAGAEWIERAGNHFEVAIEGRALVPEELSFWAGRGRAPAEQRARAWLSALPPDAARHFDEPENWQRLVALARLRAAGSALVNAAAALAIEDPLDAVRLLWLIDRRPYRKLDDGFGFDDWVDTLRFEDSGQTLSVELLEQSSRPLDLTGRVGGMRMLLTLRNITTVARGWEPGGKQPSTSYSIEAGPGIRGEARFDDGAWLQALHAGGARIDEVRRAWARLLLKTYRIPDRVRSGEDGRVVVEARQDGVWQRLYLDP